MPAAHGLLPVEHVDFTTSDPEIAQAKIAELYVRTRIQRPDTGGFAMRMARLSISGLWVDRFRLNGSLSADAEPFPDMMFGCLRGGRWSGATRREEARGRVGLVYTHPTHEGSAYTMRDLDSHVLTLPAEVVRQVAAEHYGNPGVRFLSLGPISADMQRYWRSAGEFARRQLCAPDSMLREPLVHANMVNLLATIALATFPNTTMTTDGLPRPGDTGPAALRRAVAFIDAHADEPLTLTDIAAAARVGPRELRQAFRRHHDTTPMSYVRRVRLEHAHQDLLAADPLGGDTVAAIAHRWGCASLTRFARHYRDAYGHAPRQTLHRDAP